MVLGLDGSRLVVPRTGVGRVLEHLLRTWSSQDLPFDLVRAFVPRPVEDIPGGGRIRFETVDGMGAGAWWRPARSRSGPGVHVFFAPYTLPLAYKGPRVVWNLGIQDPRFQPRDLRARARRWHFRESARRADAVIANSAATKEAIVSRYGIDPGKVRVIWPGVGGPFSPGRPEEEPRLRQAIERLIGTRDPYLLFVGKFSPRRNVPALLEALSELTREYPALHLVLVGANTARTPLDRLAAGLRLGGRVRHVEYLEQKELALLYRGALAFVLPTEQEGFSGTIPEALASGCPVVTVAHAALIEAGLDRAVVALKDTRVERLAETLSQLIADEELRAELAAAGPRAVAQLSWESSAAETAAVIAAAAAGRC